VSKKAAVAHRFVFTVIEGDHVIALCRDDTLRIHSIADITSGIDAPPLLIPLINQLDGTERRSLPVGMSINPYGLVVPNPKRDVLMKMVKWKVKLDLAIKDDQASATSGFSPPVAPESAPISDPFPRSSSTAAAPSVTISETLIWTDDIINVLASDSWIVKADTILNEGTQQATDRVAKLVEEERKRAKRGEVDGDRVSRHQHPSQTADSRNLGSAYSGNEVYVRPVGLRSTTGRSFRRCRIIVPEEQIGSTFGCLSISQVCGKEHTA
jgi:hypothetical protein